MTDLFEQLLEAGRAHLKVLSPGSAEAVAFSAVLETIGAVHSYQQASTDTAAAPAEGNKSVLALAEQISKHAGAAFQALPDVATDAVSFLWQSARPLLEGAVGHNDAGAEEAAKVGIMLLMSEYCSLCTSVMLHSQLSTMHNQQQNA